MKELLIKHEKDGRIINRFRVKNNLNLFTIGASRNCNIRVLGEDIDLVHSCFECRDGKWYVLDLGSDTGTWIDNSPVVEREIDAQTVIKIGEHDLSVDLVSVNNFNLFQSEKNIDFQGEEVSLYQQVVVFYKNEITESFLENPKKNVKIPFNKEENSIPIPQGTDWAEYRFGDLLVKNRLVKSPTFSSEEKALWEVFPKDMVRPFGISLGIAIVFFLSLYIIPKALNSDPGAIKENQYTKLIFDQKTIEKQREKSKKLAKALDKKPEKVKVKKKIVKKSTPKVIAPRKKVAQQAPSRSQRKINAKVRRVASKIKAAGLSSLVSKVSERASSKALIIKSKGIRASQKGGGRAFASISDVKKGAKIGSAAKLGSFRAGGISTKGLAGGTSVSSRLGGLSGSGIGKASVGAIEEETEVDGGLTAEQIARVVRKNIGAVRYCYERQLAAHPNLYGKIKVEFVIGPKGKVTTQKIKKTTMSNKLVEGCILRKVKRWAFPIPKGGREVAVSYPFYFKSTK